MFAYHLVLSTFIIYVFIKILYFFIQKIILINTKKRILINDETICYLPKPAKGFFFIIAVSFGGAIAYLIIPFFLYKFYMIVNGANIAFSIILESIYTILILIGLICFIVFYCCKKIIITNKRIIISWLIFNSKNTPFYEDFKAEEITALNIVSLKLSEHIQITLNNKSKKLLRGVNNPKIVLNEIKNYLNLQL